MLVRLPLPRVARPPEEATPAPPKNYLSFCILLLLREQQAHGYELLARLPDVGFKSPRRNGRYADSGVLYRVLRALEKDGFVRVMHAESSSASRRRIYELTSLGRDELDRCAHAVAETTELIDRFLDRYDGSACDYEVAI